MKITKKALKRLLFKYTMLLSKIDLWSDAVVYYQQIAKKIKWIYNRLDGVK